MSVNSIMTPLSESRDSIDSQSHLLDEDTSPGERTDDESSSISLTEPDSKQNNLVLEENERPARTVIEHPAPPYVQSLSPEARKEAERELVRKIDIRLIPAIVIMYILNYLDRNNIASARLAGLEESLNLQGSQYQTCVSILFVGYLLMQIPSNLYLSKISKPSLYLPVCMIVWGTISTATATVQSFEGLLTVRFLLGFVEAPYFPGCLYFLSTWYTRKELAFRTAMLYSGSLISGAFSGLIAAAITNGLDGARGLRAWRWLFIIEGAITISLAFGAIFILPDFPQTTAWLTPEEKQLATWRIEEDIGDADRDCNETQSFGHGFVLACKDKKMWIMMLMHFSITFSGSITNFFPTLVQTLGYGPIPSLLLTTPPYLISVLTSLLNAHHADKTSERTKHIILPLLIAIAAFLLAASTTSTIPRYVAMLLMVPGLYTGYVVALGWISNVLPRPRAKRAASLAFINAVCNTASVFASYAYLPSMAPRYVLAMTLCSGFVMVAVVCVLVLKGWLVQLNRMLERGELVDGVLGTETGFRFLI